MNRFSMLFAFICVAVLSGWLVAPKAQPKSDPADQSAKSKNEFPESWFYPNRSSGLKGLEGKTAPALNVKNWIGEQQELSKLKGKVVVIDFWGTWCPPCIASLPHNVEMVKKYGDKGLVFIGVHDSSRGSEKMEAVAKSKKINYPLSVDVGSRTATAYKVAFFPTYVAIDRTGKIRAAGLAPDYVKNVVEKLLEEKPETPPTSKK